MYKQTIRYCYTYLLFAAHNKKIRQTMFTPIRKSCDAANRTDLQPQGCLLVGSVRGQLGNMLAIRPGLHLAWDSICLYQQIAIRPTLRLNLTNFEAIHTWNAWTLLIVHQQYDSICGSEPNINFLFSFILAVIQIILLVKCLTSNSAQNSNTCKKAFC